MKQIKDGKVILFLKNDQANWVQTSNQTKNIRDKTNKKISNLGNKYYTIKNILEKMNIKRDDLFMIGKDLEKEYKDIKRINHLQCQQRRMKESLYCWFAENFFEEIVMKNKEIINKLNQIPNNKNSSNILKHKIKKATQKTEKKNQLAIQNDSENFITIQQNTKVDKAIDQHMLNSSNNMINEIENNDSIEVSNSFLKKNTESIYNNSVLNDMQMNEEIDKFELNYSNNNESNYKKDTDNSENMNFNFDNLLNF